MMARYSLWQGVWIAGGRRGALRAIAGESRRGWRGGRRDEQQQQD
jgi:hypothetical protein